MVSANGGTMTILKAKFGDNIVRTTLHHANDLTLNDLVLMLKRIFAISSDDIVLKYRDEDGDFITINDDSDLLLALQETKLFVQVAVGFSSNGTDLLQLIGKLQEDVARVLSVAAQALSASADSKAPVVSQKSASSVYNGGDLNTSFQSPPSPVPSDKTEIPATIHPSLQEEVTSHHDSVITSSSDAVSAPLEQEIPLDTHESFAPPVPDPHVFAAPPASIPSFPNSSMPPPIQPEPHYGMPGGVPGGYAPPQQQQVPQQPPTPHSSVSSTPIPQPGHHFAPPPPQQGFSHGAPPPPQGFAPPSQQQQYGGAPPPPPQQFGAPPPQQFGAPPAPQQFGAPQGFAPPSGPQGFAPPQTPQQGFAPPAPQAGPQQQPSFTPPVSAAPHQQQNFGAPPPPSFGNAPPQFGAPSEPAPPQMHGVPPTSFGAPPMGPPMSGPPQMGAPPMGGPPMGGPGGNPFARGGPPSFRQSPYQQ